MNVRRAPHDSTAAEMLSATNAVEFAGWNYLSSAHADRARFRTSGSTENRQCLACHYDAAPQKGDTGYGAVGGHSFRMVQGDDSTITLGSATAVAGTKQFVLAAPAGTVTMLKKIFPGDTLTLASGGPPDDGTYVVDSVDGARQLTVRKTTPFAGTTTSSWYITSLAKYNKASCGNCHAVPAGEFRFGARGDYDGNGSADDIQVEIAGLRDALRIAIELKIGTMLSTPVTLTPANGRIKYTITAGAKVRTIPGPSVPTSENPEIAWAAQSPTDQAAWTALYQAAYNWVFVTNDGSQGIHNTGYAVNLLQSAYKAVTGSAIGDPFVQQ